MGRGRKEREKKELVVIVKRKERTPEEDIRIRNEITQVLTEKKLLAMARRAEAEKAAKEAAEKTTV